MIYINEKKHISTIISSLNKDYKRSKIYGELKPLEIYYIDIIYNLIYNCGLEINSKNVKDLVSLYNKISHKSENICKDKILKPLHSNIKETFTQSESTDCGQIPINNKYYIYYWQEENYLTTIQDIYSLTQPSFLLDKDFDTYKSFELGKTISYNNIGRICFIDNNSNTINYEIKDILGNIITNQFDIVNIPEYNYTLFVSKNIYSFGNIFIKIKRINNNVTIGDQEENFKIFETQFENQFE
jgi:hypothetical protein